ncbi:amino acid biosynthesis protein [Limosilactobacillus sp.]|jgi:hypothetical protein|uniref:amino acid biosynthesis protein n=1 Tax=Limosilactobacillus sp. TaxID=2773925 RepID=UPI0025C692F6|nr:amino acid biosynthesis protein [Limosilactobacillus sp.]MCH3922623.1 amino acid biosynthesis protein [Limosilactobacillus sp.]MCH3927306.1 amino acid biosynthesis protein [Limosilactobacillus sp.]
MIIHTLGPEQTDSYAAALVYQHQHSVADCQIVLHPSFDALYHHLADYPSDYLLVPAAYRSRAGLSWGDLHYRYLNQLTLVDSLITQLDPLVLVQDPQRARAVVYTHAATADLARQHLPGNVRLELAPSKYLAYQAFRRYGGYALVSQKLVDPTAGVRILQHFPARMLWSVYLIEKQN